MSKDKEEFDVVKGEPQKRNNYSFVGTFIVAALIFAFLIFVFQSSIDAAGDIFGKGAYPAITSSAVALAVLIGWLQSWIFKQDLHKSHIPNYILASALGGFIGGLVGGFLRANDIFTSGFWVGAFTGLVAGTVSSLIQNGLPDRKENSSKWFTFSSISWGVIWAFGWAISWGVGGYSGISIAAAFIVALSGISLTILKGYYHFEF